MHTFAGLKLWSRRTCLNNFPVAVAANVCRAFRQQCGLHFTPPIVHEEEFTCGADVRQRADGWLVRLLRAALLRSVGEVLESPSLRCGGCGLEARGPGKEVRKKRRDGTGLWGWLMEFFGDFGDSRR